MRELSRDGFEGLRTWGNVRLEIVRKAKGQQGFAVPPWRWMWIARSPGLVAIDDSSQTTKDCRLRAIDPDCRQLPDVDVNAHDVD